MRGVHDVVVRNNKVQIKLTVSRSLTILQGKSATGKTTLLELIAAYDEFGADSGVVVNCDVPCKVLAGRNWLRDLSSIENSIAFIDEDSSFMKSHEFAHAAHRSSNYYVLVARESLPQPPPTASTRFTALRTPTAQLRSILSIREPMHPHTAYTGQANSMAQGRKSLSSKTATPATNSSPRFARKVA